MERSPPKDQIILKTTKLLTKKPSQMKTTILKLSAYVLIFALMGAGCEKKEDNNLRDLDGYIVGFNPCTFNHHYQIGYVIISTDLKDTLITYSLSDNTFKMPASVLLNSPDTLFKIPESYFRNSFGAVFQASSRYEFKIKGTFRYAEEGEIRANLCTDDLSPNYCNRQISMNFLYICDIK